jgi:hypothetical protein
MNGENTETMATLTQTSIGPRSRSVIEAAFSSASASETASKGLNFAICRLQTVNTAGDKRDISALFREQTGRRTTGSGRGSGNNDYFRECHLGLQKDESGRISVPVYLEEIATEVDVIGVAEPQNNKFLRRMDLASKLLHL